MRKLLLILAFGLGLLGPANAVVQGTTIGDASYTVTPTDQTIYTSVAFTAARTITLPNANTTCIGQSCAPQNNYFLAIYDVGNVITSTNTLTIAPASGDTINGNAANLIINAAGTRIRLVPTSPNNWFALVEGDFITSVVATGSAVSLTTNTAADIVTQSLSQGDWECRGTVARNVGATTSFTKLNASIGTTTNTLVADGTNAATYFSTAANVMATGTDTKVGPFRLVLTATTTVRLVAQDTFTVSTDAAFGELSCRRIK